MTAVLAHSKDNVAAQLRDRREAWEADPFGFSRAHAFAGFLGAAAFWHDPDAVSEADTDALNEYYHKHAPALAIACYTADLPARHVAHPHSYRWARHILAKLDDPATVSQAINEVFFETCVLAVCHEEVKPSWFQRTHDDLMWLSSLAHAGKLAVFKPALVGVKVPDTHVYPGAKWWARVFTCIQKH